MSLLPGTKGVRDFSSATSFYTIVVLSTLAINLLSLTLPVVTLQVYDRILATGNYHTLTILTMAALVLIFMECSLRWIRSYITSWEGGRFEHGAMVNTMRHLLHVEPAVMQQMPGIRYLQDMGALSRLKEDRGGQTLVAWVDISFTLIFLVTIGWLGGALLWAPLTVLFLFGCMSLLGGYQLRMMTQRRETKDEARYGYLMEIMRGMTTVKALSLEARMVRRYEHMQASSTEEDYKLAQLQGGLASLSQTFSQLIMMSVVAFGAPAVVHGHISMGTLIACVLLAGRLIQPLQRCLQLWLRHQDVQLAQQRLEELERLPVRNVTVAEKLPESKGALEMHRVSFHYPGESLPVLENASLSLRAGESIAIIGERGSGKTSLLRLLAGIYVPDDGAITVDGVEVSHIPNPQLSHYVGYIAPQPVLFRGTILQNMTGFHDAYAPQARAMAEHLGIDRALARLPRGYDSMIDDTTQDMLAPGLRQRIGIARALLHKPKLILFDHADRALDNEGYNHVYRLLGVLKGKATLVVVSDDRNILSLVDRAYRLEHAKLVPTSLKISPEMRRA